MVNKYESWTIIFLGFAFISCFASGSIMDTNIQASIILCVLAVGCFLMARSYEIENNIKNMILADKIERELGLNEHKSKNVKTADKKTIRSC